MDYMYLYRKKIIVGAGILLLTGSIIISAIQLRPAPGCTGEISLKTDLVTLELGETLDTDVQVYLDSDNQGIPDGAVLNTANVKNEVGIYKAYIHMDGRKAEFSVEVVDTTPPQLILNDQENAAVVGEPIYAWDVVASWQDYSEDIEVQLLAAGVNEKKESLMFEESGDYEVFICATDKYENASYYPLSIHVEE